MTQQSIAEDQLDVTDLADAPPAPQAGSRLRAVLTAACVGGFTLAAAGLGLASVAMVAPAPGPSTLTLER